MQQHEEEFEALHTRVAVVTFETVETVRAYVEDTGTRWPILVDPTREIYRRYGIHRGRIWNVWGLPSWRSYFKEFAKGAFPKPLRADSLQLGADLLIDPSGIIRFRHVGRGPGDRPEVEELLRTLEQLRQLKIG